VGAWNFGPFDNDDALDFLGELRHFEDSSVIAIALRHAADNNGYLEAPEASAAVAAAEIVAGLRGHAISELPEAASTWIGNHADLLTNELLPLATASVERVRSRSELQELWADSEHFPQWERSLDDLIQRLNA
jgi:hypothetical protein